ncbi:hypothetical protein ACGFRG_24810 [Streptomyces sp. NPDC048696]|uniref:hypothetical protein n=1 Tax=Streptomyces sp. NPDC048696 TaxID=3365585 RepID=UPI003712C552
MTELRTKRPAPVTAILAEVRAARKSVEDRTVPVAGGHRPHKGRAHHLHEASRWRTISASRDLDGVPGWDSTLLAAAFGTLAEQRPEDARAGLVHLAALAVAAVESIDREAA